MLAIKKEFDEKLTIISDYVEKEDVETHKFYFQPKKSRYILTHNDVQQTWLGDTLLNFAKSMTLP